MNSLLKLKIWFFIWYLKNIFGYAKISTKLIYAQTWHETGGFTSRIFKENRNLFGMRQAKIRENTATGTALGHATYKNHFSSTRDYFLRQQNFKIDSRSDNQFIIDTVASGYAEDRKYREKWLNVKNKIKTPNKLFVGIIGFFFISLILLIFKIFPND